MPIQRSSSAYRDEELKGWLFRTRPRDTNWNFEELLTALRSPEYEFERVAEGDDLLTCRIHGSVPDRSVYIYLYGADNDAVYYDLENKKRALPFPGVVIEVHGPNVAGDFVDLCDGE